MVAEGDKIKNILMVEDNPDDMFFLKHAFQKMEEIPLRVRLHEATSLTQLGLILAKEKIDLILLDLNLPDSHGIETLKHVRQVSPQIPIIIMTALNDIQTATEAIQCGAQDYLVKDEIKPRSLSRAIKYALERHNLLKKIEESLEERFRKAIDKNVDGLIVINDGDIIEYLNPAAVQILGQEQEELLGSKLNWSLDDTGESEVTLPGQNGKAPKFLAVRFTATEWNHRPAFIISCKDISQEKKLQKMEQELITNSKYVKTLSHEIRTPLAVIIGAIENMMERKDMPHSGEVLQLLQIALRNSKRLAKIIQNVLELSRLESGKAKISFTTIDLKNVITETIQGFGYYSEKKSAIIREQCPSTLPPVSGDAELIAQVLNNLVSNALRFAKNSVTVSAHVEAQKNNSSKMIRVCVEDDGPGISQDDLKDIFNRYVQLKRARINTTDYKGTGLGLAICQEIIKFHHGEIWAESEPGQGSRFYFTLQAPAEN